MIELDGAIGEGGGQVLRVALAISAITGKPLRIYNIRKKRSNPGLRHQHLTAVRAIQECCNGTVKDAFIGSTEIVFTPGKISKTFLDLDTGTAGSTTLVLQSLLPVLLYGKTRTSFRIKGGTNNPNAPTVEYFQQIFLESLKRLNVNSELKLARRGFYPRGGGIVEGWVEPVKKINSFTFTGPPHLSKVFVFAYTSRLPGHVSQRMAESSKKTLIENGVEKVETKVEAVDEKDPRCAIDPGAGIFIRGECQPLPLGVDRLGEKGVPSETVGKKAALMFLNELKQQAPVDLHLGDMLVIYAALAEGTSTYEVTSLTNHTVTSIEICKQLLEIKAEVNGRIGEKAVIKVEGGGIVNHNI
ncbi:MAG: RNA 3'-terminal phosphate cyclase [Candidatus Caldarchaeum sp.]